MSYSLEICANSVQSAINAQKAGAQRVELCDNLWESGTTPSMGSIKQARKLLNIDLFVLIRPRGGDFVYSDLAFDIMKEDIRLCKQLGVDGIVSGVLNADNSIDEERTRILIELSRPLPFTFHRAFDVTPNLFQSLNTLVQLGANRVLTSGGLEMASNAHSIIQELHLRSKGGILILPGGGINAANINKLLHTGCAEFHMTGNALRKSRAQINELKLKGSMDIPENDFWESSVEKIQEVVKIVKQHFK